MKNLQTRFGMLCSSLMMSLFFVALSYSPLVANDVDLPPVFGNIVIENASCFGGSNGSASLHPSGGVAPYTYLWSTGSTSSSISNLSAAIYAFTVTDQNGDFRCDNFYVGQATSIQANLSRTNNICHADNNGRLTLAPSGGHAPYTYTWSNGSTASVINNLATGPYSYTITDSNGCSKAGSISVLANNPIIGHLTINDLDCYGDSNGSATLSGSGGTGGPFTYAWSNGATGVTVNNLSAGSHSYTVTDNMGCSGSGSFAVQQPAPVWTSFTYKYACFGIDNGSVSVSANGGTPPYTYEWNTGATTSSINNLGMGMYFYTVTDSRGCQSATGLACIFNSNYTLNASASSANCVNGNDGSANLIASSGFSPYTYQWSNGATTANITDLAPGVYSYTVTDTGSCPISGSITISQGSDVTASVTQLANGNLQASASGGVEPYFYNWNNGETGAIATNYTSGTYSVTATDINGCTDVVTGTYMTTSTCPGNVTYPGTIGSDQYLCAPGNTPATIVGLDAPTGGVGPIEYVWMKSSTSGTFDPNFFFPEPNSNSPNYSPGPLEATTYFIRCVRRDGCVYIESNTVTITVGDEIAATIEHPALGCFGETQTYSAGNLPPFANVSWSFSGSVTVNTTTGPSVDVTFIGAGYLDVVMTVTTNDCVGVFTDRVTISGDCFGSPYPVLGLASAPASLYPNPVNDRVTINLGTVSDQESTINLYSITQNLLASYKVSAGLKHYDIAMEQLPTGMYYVQLQKANGDVETLKVLKN